MIEPEFITDQQLLDYAQDLLTESEARLMELILRGSPELQSRLNELLKHDISGQHSLGNIWRNQHLSCPDRSTWGRYLLGLVTTEEHGYLEFHLTRVRCSFCRSNLEDLSEAYQEQQGNDKLQQEIKSRTDRRDRIFQTSRGFLQHD